MRIVSIAPSRISLFGGGTDVEPYTSEYGGFVINMAVNIYYKFEMFYDNDLWDHRAENNVPYGGEQEFVFKILDNWDLDSMHHTTFKSEYDGIINAGLGASASASVGIVSAVNKRLGLNMSRSELAECAWDIEVKKLNLYGGKQDQIASSFGGVNAITFGKDVKVQSFPRASINKIKDSILLFSTGKTTRHSVLQNNFRIPTKEQREALHKIKELAQSAVQPMLDGDWETLGKLLDKSWELKKQSNTVTTPEIDNYYKRAKKNGALGFKICGAGGGGYAICIVPPKIRDEFIKNMGLEHWDFEIDYTGVNTRILPK